MQNGYLKKPLNLGERGPSFDVPIYEELYLIPSGKKECSQGEEGAPLPLPPALRPTVALPPGCGCEGRN